MNNQNFNLQVLLDTDIKNKATINAKKQGFSSLQEITRFLLTQLASGKLSLGVLPSYNSTETLSDSEDIRLSKLVEESSQEYKNGESLILNNGSEFIKVMNEENNLFKKFPEKIQRDRTKKSKYQDKN